MSGFSKVSMRSVDGDTILWRLSYLSDWSETLQVEAGLLTNE